MNNFNPGNRSNRSIEDIIEMAGSRTKINKTEMHTAQNMNKTFANVMKLDVLNDENFHRAPFAHQKTGTQHVVGEKHKTQEMPWDNINASLTASQSKVVSDHSAYKKDIEPCPAEINPTDEFKI